MGENKNIEELDAFAKKYVKEISIEAPTYNFTETVMSKIDTLKIDAPYKTTPLISNYVWFIIAIIVIALFGVSFISAENEPRNVLKLDFSFIEKFQISAVLENVAISNIVVYAFLFFGFMITIQIVYLKNYFEKQFN